MGFVSGTISGLGSAVQYSNDNNLNLLTGRPNQRVLSPYIPEPLPIPMEGIEAAKTGVQTTLHGAERIAGASATRGGVLTQEGIVATKSLGRAITQADGATVYLHEVSSGRFNAVVEGSKGIITTMENWSQKSILRISKNYGWKLE